MWFVLAFPPYHLLRLTGLVPLFAKKKTLLPGISIHSRTSFPPVPSLPLAPPQRSEIDQKGERAHPLPSPFVQLRDE